jgi:PIN domain nuclease of toxin-antitoxin system
MKILLDTHIFLWAIAKPENIAEKWRFEIETRANQVFLSSVSVAEIMIKASIGKLQVNYHPLEIAQKSGFEMLDFKAEDALLLKNMPFYHRDPFDRMLIAQGINNHLCVLTDDDKFRFYDCKLMR